MKLELNFIYKMLKILRFFRRERRSVEVSESKEAGQGLAYFQYSAFYK